MLYFAYGSNLNEFQMLERCPNARREARAMLSDYTLKFGGHSENWGGGVANIVPAANAGVYGLLYTIDKADLAKLDRFEGHPFVYERVMLTTIDEYGRNRRAHVYVQPLDRFKTSAVAPQYFRVLKHAYTKLDFDLDFLEAAKRRSSRR